MKKINVLVLILISLLIFGCSNKKSLTYDDFKAKLEKEKYTIADVTEQFKEYDYIKGAYLAISSDTNYQVEFYLFEDGENAKSFYNLNKEILEAEGADDNTYTNVDSKEYNKYTLTTEDKYNSITRIDNTVVYSSNNKKYKTKIEKVIKKLGY